MTNTPPIVDVYIKIPEDIRTMLRVSAEVMGMTVSEYITARVRKDAAHNGVANLVLRWDEDEVLELTGAELAREIGDIDDLV